MGRKNKNRRQSKTPPKLANTLPEGAIPRRPQQQAPARVQNTAARTQTLPGARFLSRVDGRSIISQDSATATNPQGRTTFMRDSDGPIMVLEHVQRLDQTARRLLRGDIRKMAARPEYAPDGKSFPQQIIMHVNNNNADQAKADVLALLKETNAQNRDGKELRLVQTEVSPIPGTNSSDLRFKIIEVQSVMTQNTLTNEMGRLPRKNGDTVYKRIQTRLKEYHKILNQFRDDLNTNGDRIDKAENYQQAIDSLKEQIKKDAEELAKRSDQKTQQAMTRLIDQLDNSQDLEAIRMEYFKFQHNPLTDDSVTVGNDIVLGSGAQGEVRAVTYQSVRLPDGSIVAPFTAGRKVDSTDISDPAKGTKVSINDPQQAKRAVAVYNVNNQLGLGVIPPTVYMIKNNPENGQQEFGQAMEFVHGTPGAREVDILEYDMRNPDHREIVDTYRAQQAILERGPRSDPDYAYQAAKDNEHELRHFRYDHATQRAYKTSPVPVNVDLTSPVVQRDLANLQVLDVIVGHPDRHAGNFMFQTRGAGDPNILAVKGIDNDDAFGRDWEAVAPNDFGVPRSKTAGVPPVVDAHAAIKVLEMTNADLHKAMKDLPPAEIHAAITRLNDTKRTILERVKSGDVAVAPGEPLSVAEWNKLSALTNIPQDALPHLNLWGSSTFSKNRDRNSYIAEMQANVRANGQPIYPNFPNGAPPVFK